MRPQGLIGNSFNNDADDCTDNNSGNYAENRVSGRFEGDENSISADHDDIAVGKVQHLGDTINHCVAQSDKSIDSSQAESVQNCRQHLIYSFSFISGKA